MFFFFFKGFVALVAFINSVERQETRAERGEWVRRAAKGYMPVLGLSALTTELSTGPVWYVCAISRQEKNPLRRWREKNLDIEKHVMGI